MNEDIVAAWCDRGSEKEIDLPAVTYHYLTSLRSLRGEEGGGGAPHIILHTTLALDINSSHFADLSPTPA